VDIRIGVTYTAKEITVELADGAKADTLRAEVAAAISGDNNMLWIEDKKGRQVGVPSDKIAYVEIGSEDANRIGFG
jgi:hypothetical protein